MKNTKFISFLTLQIEPNCELRMETADHILFIINDDFM